MVGWVSGHCQGFRSQMFQALQRAAAEAGVEGVDSLGNCEHNRDFSNETAWPPGDAEAWDIYPDYRWVMAMENSAEVGYVTEKLPNALAAGAVPIYYGDSVAARKIFKEEAYVDVLRVWRETLPARAHGLFTPHSRALTRSFQTFTTGETGERQARIHLSLSLASIRANTRVNRGTDQTALLACGLTY